MAKSGRSRRWEFLKSNKCRAGIVIILIFLVVSLLGPYIAPYPRNYAKFGTWLAPSIDHLLGTDSYGQDVLSQMIYGARTSLSVGVLSGVVATIVGVVVGLIAGFKRGWLSELLMRIVDLFLVIPILVLMIILASFLPSMGITTMVLVIGLLSWLYMARIVRSQTLAERAKPYIEAARLVGIGDTEIMFREILPNLMPVIIANFVMISTSAVLAEAGLDFLGIGDPTAVSWGTILSLAYDNNAIMYHAWWWIIPPGVAIGLLGFGFVLIGNGLLELYQSNRGSAAV